MENEKEKRDFKGIWIPKNVWLDSNLSALEKMILMEIDSLDTEEGHCFASNEYLAKFCQCSERKVTEAISKLIEIGYISLFSFDGRKRVLISNLAKQTSKKCESNGGGKVRVAQNSTNNTNNKQYTESNNIDNINNNDLKEKYKKENNFDDIFNYWNTKKLTVHKESNDLMKQAYQKTLKNFTNEQIKNAIDNYAVMYKDIKCWVENKYSLTTFLSQSNLIVNFVDGGTWWETYNDKKNKPYIVKQNNGLVDYKIDPNASYHNRGDNDF